MEQIFRGTDITYNELTTWIKNMDTNKRINEIRYFGSRCFGQPRPDSDIDVFLLMDECDDEDDKFSKGPIFSMIYKGYVIEFHPMIDFHDGYIPSYLIGDSTKNELSLYQEIKF